MITITCSHNDPSSKRFTVIKAPQEVSTMYGVKTEIILKEVDPSGLDLGEEQRLLKPCAMRYKRIFSGIREGNEITLYKKNFNGQLYWDFTK